MAVMPATHHFASITVLPGGRYRFIAARRRGLGLFYFICHGYPCWLSVPAPTGWQTCRVTGTPLQTPAAFAIRIESALRYPNDQTASPCRASPAPFHRVERGALHRQNQVILPAHTPEICRATCRRVKGYAHWATLAARSSAVFPDQRPSPAESTVNAEDEFSITRSAGERQMFPTHTTRILLNMAVTSCERLSPYRS